MSLPVASYAAAAVPTAYRKDQMSMRIRKERNGRLAGYHILDWRSGKQ